MKNLVWFLAAIGVVFVVTVGWSWAESRVVDLTGLVSNDIENINHVIVDQPYDVHSVECPDGSIQEIPARYIDQAELFC